MAASRDDFSEVSGNPDEAALQWLMRLREAGDGPSSAGLRRAFSLWLQADPAHRQAYEKRAAEWQALEPLAHRYRLAAAPAPSARRRWLAGSLVAAGAACAGVAAWQLLPRDGAIEFERTAETAPGRSETLELPDGSRIVLDASARVDVRYQARSRVVALQGGAAFFDVARDASRPFEVEAGWGRITVLGTAFEVERALDFTKVSVLRGSVGVRHEAGGSVVLTGGQGVSLQSRHMGAVRSVPADHVASWRSGRLIFEAMPLQQVADALVRRGLAQVRVAPNAAQLPVTFVVRTDDVDSALQALPDVLPVRVQRHGAEIRVARR
ncbi:inner membrane sensor protein [Bordetella ansorpii]|uniref:Inner membrane sensor protein n=1 Tax=Bordetella ansorpii TaxID=288768 RepID=A0A157PIZ5_9BORD|nr:FecR domain-containing protein [Bordetella ansorpii]SAI33334.1 inner membrane sensor protein [Bordetella ansorpii]